MECSQKNVWNRICKLKEQNKGRYEGEQTKKNIADKAKTLFSRRRYAATSIRDICDAAGCSKGNLYYHFKSKEDLFLYLEEQTFSEWWDQLDTIFSQYESFTEKLYVFGDFISGIERPLRESLLLNPLKMLKSLYLKGSPIASAKMKIY